MNGTSVSSASPDVIAVTKLKKYPPSVDRVIEFSGSAQLYDKKGNKVRDFVTKSTGLLDVPFAVASDSKLEMIMKDFLRGDPDELALLPGSIMGIRSYRVRDIPDGKAGGNELHRIREA